MNQISTEKALENVGVCIEKNDKFTLTLTLIALNNARQEVRDKNKQSLITRLASMFL